MKQPLEGLDFDRWYVVWIACALVVLAAAIAGGQHIWALGALGALLIGLGELKNHPLRQHLIRGGIIYNRTRQPSLFGLALDAIGIGVIGLAAFLGLRAADLVP